ncbi:MAG: hypothetical protein JWP65_3580 [Ramlibacter sp.]|jgi:hypothetical protein|uniref:hypothetical protein n=1 Tax=Ramlibacter sp. TaxID=1917967 RepID=UPI00262D9053|nr:hypothetical protein [Ramlibacter sp.]MDB5753159.1 hypothetical protein [Ramlibacter sp.]
MQIHQMSVTYLPEQDRILMRINTTDGEEMRMWLTRRLMVGLWPLLTKLLTEHLLKLESAGASLAGANPELKKMLADFRKEEFLQHADFDTPYKEGQASLPLGEEPLLVTDVDATPLANGPLKLNFNERTPSSGDSKPRSFQMEMQPKLMQGLMHLLDQAMLQSQWREPFVQPAASEPGAAEGDDGRPKYLN